MIDLVAVPRSWKCTKAERQRARERRAKLRALKICINAPLPGARKPFWAARVKHGPPNEKSGKCDRCEKVAKESR